MEKEKILELFIKGDRQTKDHLWMGYPFMRDEFDYLERNGYQSLLQERDIKRDFEHLLASRTKRMESNVLREILKVISEPGVVSLAGGIPSPESFPVESINELLEIVEKKYGARAFQYDSTEGFPPLREALAGYLQEKRSMDISMDDLLISSGSQGMLDAIGKALISKGDSIAVEAPTYLGAIQAFNPYEPDFVPLKSDDQGLIPESLEEALETHRIKFVYLVPTFQNPTGRTIPYERREKIAKIIRRHEALLVEDDPYSSLRFQGEEIPPIKKLAPENVVYLGTLSKVFAPGLRIGFCLAPEWIRKWLIIAKQGVDLHTSTYNQALAAEYISGGYLERHLPNILEHYRPRYKAMLDALDRNFPKDYKWSRPDGGMFIWVEGPEGSDIEKIYRKAIEKKVAFVPGRFFYTQKGKGLGTMRLNYTMCDEGVLNSAIKTLSEVIDQESD